ncbi:DUF2231 domain-containing protein [Sporolactobacillus sp. Y61]|uniref:DUF2231 domain-containing protein n=1 Tax=Sporolactobacillus sp. Y61 TaxID=3160863 RepID=A0AAU8IHA5_9BACL|nr:DUF2231 domain-containing protein [Sporolactobacillus sp. THM19-2]RYL88078.1 hypothetical protein EWH91_12000 [Sporolactobacillus sp. THM19-2]
MSGIPLHPLLVHFPIALLLMGTVLQIVAIWKKKFFDKAALLLLSTGFISGVAAYLSGGGAVRFAAAHWGSAYKSLAEIHELYAFATMVLFGIAISLRMLLHYFRRKFLMPLILVFCILGSVTLGITGHYGGQMVYVQKHAGSAVTTLTVSR